MQTAFETALAALQVSHPRIAPHGSVFRAVPCGPRADGETCTLTIILTKNVHLYLCYISKQRIPWVLPPPRAG